MNKEELDAHANALMNECLTREEGQFKEFKDYVLLNFYFSLPVVYVSSWVYDWMPVICTILLAFIVFVNVVEIRNNRRLVARKYRYLRNEIRDTVLFHSHGDLDTYQSKIQSLSGKKNIMDLESPYYVKP